MHLNATLSASHGGNAALTEPHFNSPKPREAQNCRFATSNSGAFKSPRQHPTAKVHHDSTAGRLVRMNIQAPDVTRTKASREGRQKSTCLPRSLASLGPRTSDLSAVDFKSSSSLAYGLRE